MINAILLSSLLCGQYGYGYNYQYPAYRVYHRRPAYRYWVEAPVFWVWSTPRTYQNRPRQISPGHREQRLAWERKRLTETGQKDQLRHAVRQLWANASDDEPLQYLAIAIQTDDYARMRWAVAKYKMQKGRW